jgi:hypothetical protein
MIMSKKQEKSAIKEQLTADFIRQWSLETLMGTVEAELDLSQCGKPEYLANLDRKQTAKIKRINYDRYGNISSVEPTGIVDLIVAAANIAGTREAAKAKAEKQAKEDAQKEESKKYRGNKLTLNINTKTEAKPKKNEPPAPEKSDSGTFSQLIGK